MVGQQFPTSMEHFGWDEHCKLRDGEGGEGGGNVAGVPTPHTAQLVFVAPPADSPGAQQRQPQFWLYGSDHMM